MRMCFLDDEIAATVFLIFQAFNNNEKTMDKIKQVNLINKIKEVKLSLVPAALIATLPFSWISEKIDSIESKFH